MNTISPGATRATATSLAQTSSSVLDGPVSGGPFGAKNAALSIMVGSDRSALGRAEAVMCTTVTHVGAPGAEQTVKLRNHLTCAVNIQAVCETVALGRANGIYLKHMRDEPLGRSAFSWMLDKLGPAAGDASARFRIDLTLKDLRLVLEMAGQKDAPLAAIPLVTALHVAARAHGEASDGNEALFRADNRMMGSECGRARIAAGRP